MYVLGFEIWEKEQEPTEEEEDDEVQGRKHRTAWR